MDTVLEIKAIAFPLLLLPLSIGLLLSLSILLFVNSKKSEMLFLTVILAGFFCMSLLTYAVIGDESLTFFSKPFHHGAIVTIGSYLAVRILLLSKLDWKGALPEIILFLGSLMLLPVNVIVSGTILSLFLMGFAGYRIWVSYNYEDSIWAFGSHITFGLLGIFGFIGMWFPFDGGRFLFALLLVTILGIIQLQVFDFVMENLKSASKSSVTDSLTNLYNKGFLVKKATELGTYQEIGIIFADIDNFKSLNDEKGHDQGDLVLKDVARFLRDAMAGQGYCCRFGGEEFVGIVTRGDASKKAEKFRRLVEKHTGVTVSVGVAMSSSELDGPATIKSADMAMYEAKKNGKNRVVMAGAIQQNGPSATEITT